MTIDKRISYDVQGGVKNYLGKQKEVTAPVKWKSSPDHPETELAYITKAEKDLLVKKDLHGSLKGGVNRGPSGIMSLNGFGSADESQNVSGSQMSAAESGNFSGFSGTGGGGGPQLPPGVDRKPSKTAQDIRSSFIAAGGGQRVNPGFFDSRNTVSPIELARARALNPAAFKATRGGGLMGFLTSGGILGNLIRGLGQRFGLGKTYNQPTYDMSGLSGLPFGGTAAFENLDIRDIYDRRKTDEEDEEDEDIFTDTVAPMSVNNNIEGIRFNNPIGGVDQFAREMEALEASIPRRPGQTEDISMRIRPRDMTGTLRDFYTNKGQTVTLGDGQVVPTTGDTLFEVYDDNINFRNLPTDLGNPYNDPRVVPEEMGLVGNKNLGELVAKVTGPALIQMRTLEKKKAMSEYGGTPLTIEEENKLNQLKKMDADQAIYSAIV